MNAANTYSTKICPGWEMTARHNGSTADACQGKERGEGGGVHNEGGAFMKIFTAPTDPDA